MESIIYKVLLFLMNLSYFGIALGLMVEVIPSELVLGYAGFLISQGKINFLGALLSGIFGGVMAQLFLYWIGYYGGRSFLLKYGKFILIGEKQINQSQKWFEKYGVGVVFTARFIPVVRHAISIPAGISKMGFWKFTLYTTLAMLPWSVFFIYMGYELGNNWSMIEEISRPYIQPMIVVMSLILALYISYSLIKKK